MKKPEPYGDTDAEQKRSADLRFQRYQERIESEAAFFRAKLLTLWLKDDNTADGPCLAPKTDNRFAE